MTRARFCLVCGGIEAGETPAHGLRREPRGGYGQVTPGSSW